MIKKYLKIYFKLFAVTLQAKLEYRFNFFVELFYGPAYTLVLFLLVRIAYGRSPLLGGLSLDEGLLLFSVYQLLYLLGILLFFMSIRYFLWEGVRYGQVDLILTKPVNPQFMITFGKPEVQQLPLFLIMILLFCRQVIILGDQIQFVNLLIFLIWFFLGLVILYFSISTFATLGFFVTRAQQIIEFFDKVADNSQYPTPIFPFSLQMVAFSLIPIAFFGYVQTLFLLGKGSWHHGLIGILLLIILIPLNQFMWKKGLQHYSSASS